MFNNIFKGKRVLVTGHTGFKGSWLTLWLLQLEAEVYGYSIDIPTNPSNYEALGLDKYINESMDDIRDLDMLKKTFDKFKPEIVFHLAAQPLVRYSYDSPHETFLTNTVGTVNVLECVRKCNSVQAVVIITSDKCYKNVEWIWGYRENDTLGGDDPYSASKACAEIATNSYVKSFYDEPNSKTKIATTRAGNVIGGGDWACDRIVPDCIRSWAKGKELLIRSPNATRPWQHVLEPLRGYLILAGKLLQENSGCHKESFNFGPNTNITKSVIEVINEMQQYWGDSRWRVENINGTLKKESTLLKLNCDKAQHYLNWLPILEFDETIKLTSEWYKAYYDNNIDMFELTVKQINYYSNLSVERNAACLI